MADIYSKQAPPTEQAIRAEIRDIARRNYHDQNILLSAEVIGVACEISLIAEPALAIKEIVDDAVDRWARRRVLERMSESHDSGEEIVTKSLVPPRTSKATRKRAPSKPKSRK